MSFGEVFVHEAVALCTREFPLSCGGDAVVVEVAGGRYLCRGLLTDQAAVLRRRYAGEPLAAAGPVVEIGIARAEADDFKAVELAGGDYHFDLQAEPDGVLLAGWDFAARIMLRPQLSAVLWTPRVGGDRFEAAFANLLRVVVAYALLDGGGVLLHSAAVVDEGAATLFVGVSGAGKSTVSRLALESGRLVLSDDLNAVVVDGGRPWVQQVPFTGDLGGSRTTRGRFPLGRVFRLRQAAAAALRPMSRAEAVALLYGCAPYVNADPLRRDQLLANLEACMAGVPAGELSFRRDGTFWPLLAGRKAS